MAEFRTVRYQERQAFEAWIYVILLISPAVSLFFGTQTRVAVAVAPCVVMALAANLLSMSTVVTDSEIQVTFGYLIPYFRRTISRSEIGHLECITYEPVRDYGGWGIKGRRDNLALNARGNRGVRLTLRDGKRLLIGSQRPDALAHALAQRGT